MNPIAYPMLTFFIIMYVGEDVSRVKSSQATRDSNPQPTDLESVALPN